GGVMLHPHGDSVLLDHQDPSLSGVQKPGSRPDLVERMVPYLRRLRQDHPDLPDLYTDSPRGEKFVRETLETVLRELYNPAQLDVLHRTHVIVDESTQPRPGRNATELR
ncbi:hypothetical protein ABZY14_29835, partial [Streptomyces sp. NPDC006617]